MKKIFLIVAFFATAFVQQSFARDNKQPAQLSQLLHSYYDIKNALVAGDATTAASKAEEFVKIVNGISSNKISEEARNGLLKEATQIAKTKEISHQREHFATFSTILFSLAKSVKLTSDPIYEAYCPMKKVYWLSSEKDIKNPYYGKAMLTCGSVKETLQ